jgi:AraC family transcriptional regulator
VTAPGFLLTLFCEMLGETPERYSLRLRLECAVFELLASRGQVRFIAAGVGFGGHEVFTRAFRRNFGPAPGITEREH